MPADRIVLARPLPPRPRPMDRRVRLAAGLYPTERGGRVLVPAQVADVDGWHYSAWEGAEPTEATLYVLARADHAQG